MNHFLVLLLFLTINSASLAQPVRKYILFPLDEVQANGLVSAIEFYKINYSSKIYGFSAAEEGDNIIVLFDISPKKNPFKIPARRRR